MNITIMKKEDGFWLSLDGKQKALINLGEKYPPIVTGALEEAIQQSSRPHPNRGYCACGNLIGPADQCLECAGLI